MPLFTTELNTLADSVGVERLDDPIAHRRANERESDERTHNGRRTRLRERDHA